MTSLARIAKSELDYAVQARLPARWKFVIRHRRFFPGWLRYRALRVYSDVRIEAEASLPRRYRRILRGGRMMVPGSGT